MSEPVKTRPSLLGTVAAVPINLFIVIVSRLLSAIRPFAPKLIPLIVCSLFIPLILLLSASAGWVIWSSLSVSWEVPLYLQYGDGVPPYAFVSLPSLVPKQRYDISVDLVLPYTDSNIALGNFMTTLTISTLNNKTLAHVRRPAIALPPRSRFLLPKKASEKVKVPLLESFVAGKSNLAANVVIGRQDRWTTLGQGDGREVSVVSAYLRGVVVPHGIRGLAIRFPLLSAVVSAGIFIFILTTILGTCVLPLLLPTPQEDDDEFEAKIEPERPEFGVIPESKPREGRRASRRRRSRSSKSSDERTIKTEERVQDISQQDEDPTRGLRRRSSKPVLRHSDEE